MKIKKYKRCTKSQVTNSHFFKYAVKGLQLQKIHPAKFSRFTVYMSTVKMVLVATCNPDNGSCDGSLIVLNNGGFLTFEIALVNLPVIFLQILAAKAVEEGGNSLITVFKPEKEL